LLHAPEPRVLELFDADGYQLALSGHTHGGQICLPNGKAIVTNCGIDRERASGLHRFGSMFMHVSNGLGTSKYAPVRLFCRPSATLLRIVEK
ncbi:MAG: metallophosphoesterase, partial [Corynebacterium durum]